MTSDKDASATPRRERRDAGRARRRLDFGAEAPSEELPPPRDEAAERLAARLRWNFDFENEQPLDGDWEWERVDAEAEARPRREAEAKDSVNGRA